MKTNIALAVWLVFIIFDTALWFGLPRDIQEQRWTQWPGGASVAVIIASRYRSCP